MPSLAATPSPVFCSLPFSFSCVYSRQRAMRPTSALHRAILSLVNLSSHPLAAKDITNEGHATNFTGSRARSPGPLRHCVMPKSDRASLRTGHSLGRRPKRTPTQHAVRRVLPLLINRVPIIPIPRLFIYSIFVGGIISPRPRRTRRKRGLLTATDVVRLGPAHGDPIHRRGKSWRIGDARSLSAAHLRSSAYRPQPFTPLRLPAFPTAEFPQFPQSLRLLMSRLVNANNAAAAPATHTLASGIPQLGVLPSRNTPMIRYSAWSAPTRQQSPQRNREIP